MKNYAGFCALAPFTVLVEPRSVDILRSGSGGDMEYILRAQLMEADLIVLNKRDLLSPTELSACLDWLGENYPEAEVISISALTGEGMEELSLALKNGVASLRLPDIGYGGAAFGKAMGQISEFYMQYYATVCCDDFDGSAYLMELGRSIQQSLSERGRDIPHLKLLAWDSEGDYGKADLLGVARDIVLTKDFENPCTEISVMLNASADCPAAELEPIMDEAIDEVSARFNLELMLYKRQCFDMGG